MNSCPICNEKKIKDQFKVPGATVSKCTSCFHSFSRNLKFSPEEIYDEDYFIEHHKNWFLHPNFPLFARIASMCEKEYGGKDISILDVGCGNGDFLKYLYSKGFSKLTGLDFTANQHESIEFIQTNIFQVAPQSLEQKFDVVTSLATIEHVEDVQHFLKILASFVKPGGTVCVMTLDENSFLYRFARLAKKFGFNQGVNRLYDKHHINHFSKKSLRDLMIRKGKFEIFEHYTINFPINAIDLPKSKLNLVIKPIIHSTFILTSAIRKMEFLQVISAKVHS